MCSQTQNILKWNNDKLLMYNSENQVLFSAPFSLLEYMDEDDTRHGKIQPTLLKPSKEHKTP